VNPTQNGNWRRLVFIVLASATLAVAGCSRGPILKSSPVARTLSTPSQWLLSSEERELRKAVESDKFPEANEDGL